MYSLIISLCPMNYTNLTRQDCHFTDYMRWPEYSHSGLKYGHRPPKEATDNMVFGKIVDAILCNEVTPELYAHAFYPHALRHVETINSKFAFAIAHMDKQPSYRGRIEHNGWTLPVRVRLDMQLGDTLLFENKITFAGCQSKKAPAHVKIASMIGVIDYMAYDNQVFHQMEMSGVGEGFIMIHSVPLDETFLFRRLETEEERQPCIDWWSKQVSLYGL